MCRLFENTRRAWARGYENMTILEKHISGINIGLERVGSLKAKWINKWALQSDWEQTSGGYDKTIFNVHSRELQE